MNSDQKRSPAEDLARIIDSGRRLGVEIDEEEALQWLAAIAAVGSGQEIVVDMESGVFGHRASMLDFDSEELEYFRLVGNLVEFNEEPGVVETALALSGSSAQSKIQAYPGDLDFFERVNIKASTRQEACNILSRLMRDKAMTNFSGPGYVLIEVKFGNHPADVIKEGDWIKAGAPIAWSPEEVKAGKMQVQGPNGEPGVVTWDDLADDPGWCKLDWVVADPVRGQVSNASNMLDVTWEAQDGNIVPLDGYLDPYFQEVYLEADSIPIFSKLVRHVSTDALDDYVQQLEKEVEKYLTRDVNYGKAAKRMYNIFRLTGRYHDAAYLRELFDEPTTILYQIWALIRTVDEADEPGSGISTETIMAQADDLILSVVGVLEGEKESEIVRHLLRLRDSVASEGERPMRMQQIEVARAELINLVNNFFYDRLTAMPSIKSYMDEFRSDVEDTE